MSLASVAILALIGEALWETLKVIWDKGKLSIDRIGALVIGLVLSFATGTDLLKLVGLQSKIPFLGIILTGILISRGANFMHDILSSINNLNQNTKASIQGMENPTTTVK